MTDNSVLFQSSPVLRWFLVIVLAPSIIIIPFLPIPWNAERVMIIVGLETFFCLIVAACLIPSFALVGWRIVAGMFFLFFTAYFVSELQKNGWKLGRLGRGPGASASNALVGLITVGLPCLRYAIAGRLLRQ